MSTNEEQHVPSGRSRAAFPWGPAGYWAAVGFLYSFGVAAILSIGIFFLGGALAMTVWGAVRKVEPRALPALLVGAGLTPLYIAALNWRGPGMVCQETATSRVCSEYFNPVPFAIAGLAIMILGGLVLRTLHAKHASVAVD